MKSRFFYAALAIPWSEDLEVDHLDILQRDYILQQDLPEYFTSVFWAVRQSYIS